MDTLLLNVNILIQHLFACLCSSLVQDVDVQVMTFEDFGKDVPKQFKVSPDGFIQNAIQLAYFK